MSEPLRNDELPAGSPMWFRCIECRSLIVVPEMYLLKPRLCPDCGGAWCRSEDPVALRRQGGRVGGDEPDKLVLTRRRPGL